MFSKVTISAHISYKQYVKVSFPTSSTLEIIWLFNGNLFSSYFTVVLIQIYLRIYVTIFIWAYHLTWKYSENIQLLFDNRLQAFTIL